ncbi:hypothetical protein BT69DRAFT_720801 [Atractiella rhizophila]|nr:hypothetical protein BT69DRAFT_720801 [Atractiella rhizophila]
MLYTTPPPPPITALTVTVIVFPLSPISVPVPDMVRCPGTRISSHFTPVETLCFVVCGRNCGCYDVFCLFCWLFGGDIIISTSNLPVT